MKEAISYVAGATVVVACIAGAGWLLTGNHLAMSKVFNPEFEQARRDTFEQSKAYRDGMVQELRAMQFEYVKADPAHQAGLASVIRHRLAGFPTDALPADLQLFVQQLP